MVIVLMLCVIDFNHTLVSTVLHNSGIFESGPKSITISIRNGCSLVRVSTLSNDHFARTHRWSGAFNITSHFVKLGRLCAHALFYKTRHYAPAVSCTHPFICRLFQRAFVSASLLFKRRQGKREELSSLQVNECERVGVYAD